MANLQPKSSRKSTPPNSKKRKSVWDNLFANNRRALVKIGSCAIATPIVIVTAMRRRSRQSGEPFHIEPWAVALLVLGGAAIGTALAVKDVVDQRLNNNQPVSPVLLLMFGKGLLSLLLVWVPIVFFTVLIATLATL